MLRSGTTLTPGRVWIWRIWALLAPLGNTSLSMLLFLIRDVVELGSRLADRLAGRVAGKLNRREDSSQEGRGSSQGERLRQTTGTTSADTVPDWQRALLTHQGRARLWLGLLLAAMALSAGLHPFRWSSWGNVLGFGCLSLLMIHEGSKLAQARGGTGVTVFPGLVVGSVLVSLWGILGTYWYHWPRAVSPFQGENAFGTLLILAGGLGFSYLFSRYYRQGARRGFGWVLYVLPWAYLLLIGTALLLTRSRGAWVGFSIFLAVFALGQPRSRWFALLSVALGLFVVLAHPSLHARFLSIFSWSANEDRVTIWQTAVTMIRDHPWLGVGPGNFGLAFDFYKKVPNMVAASAHNIILTTWAESGIAAVLFLLLFVTELIAAQIHLLFAQPRDPLRWAYLGSTLGVLFHQLVDHTLFSVELLGFFMGLVGLSLGQADQHLAEARTVRFSASPEPPDGEKCQCKHDGGEETWDTTPAWFTRTRNTRSCS